MRRGRHKLQVSTFPFLAVLLAAMGSLILLLLVMDRRAKIVARSKTQEALAAKEQQTGEMEEKRRGQWDKQQSDWEQQQAALHAYLASQVQDLLALKAKEGTKANQVGGQLRLEKEQLQALEDHLAKEKAKLTKDQQALQERYALVAEKDSTSQEFLAERQKLAGQLAQLEAALRDLQMLKGQEQNTYSLVAYRGKRGDNRRPIYVECRRDGVVFHPGGKTLTGLELNEDRFRAEVQAQGAELERTPVPQPGTRKRPPAALTGPYVLFLVRPDAIEIYYDTASALKGYQIDFGYELIEREWLLDFGGKQVAGNRGQGSGVSGQEVGGMGLGGNAPGQKGSGAPHPGIGMGHSGNGPGQLGPGFDGPAGSGPGAGNSGHGNGLSGKSSGPGFSGQSEGGQGTGMTRPGGERGIFGSGPGMGPTGAGTQFASLAGPGNGGGGSAGVHGELRTGFGTSVPWLGGAASGFPSTGFGTARFGLGGAGGNGIDSGSPGNGSANAGGHGSSSGPESAGNQVGGSKLNNADSSTKPVHQTGPENPAWRPTQTPGELGGDGGGGEPKDPLESPNSLKPKIPLNLGSGGTGGESDPLNRLPLPGPPQTTPPKSKPAPLPSRLTSNRDYVITIECYEDSAAVYPGGQVFPAHNGAAVARYVQQLIARRQASVRPGEPPYRPQLRFQVQPDGLRTYYRVFPALEGLRLPMSRENVAD